MPRIDLLKNKGGFSIEEPPFLFSLFLLNLMTVPLNTKSNRLSDAHVGVHVGNLRRFRKRSNGDFAH